MRSRERHDLTSRQRLAGRKRHGQAVRTVTHADGWFLFAGDAAEKVLHLGNEHIAAREACEVGSSMRLPSLCT